MFTAIFKREVHATICAFVLLFFHVFVKYLQGNFQFLLAMFVYSFEYNVETDT